MKNTLILVLLVAVGILAFLFVQRQPKGGPPPGHKDHNGNAVNVEECARTGQDNKTCVILISYLQGMHGDSDLAIGVRHNDTIKWVGDSGETIHVQPMPGVDCTDHHKPDKPNGGEDSLIGPISGSGNIQIAKITGNPKNDLYCYKTNIIVTLNGQNSTIDPHLFDEGP